MEGAAEVPRESGKNMCACMSCKLVKTYAQFIDRGCENCDYLNMEGDSGRVTDCTTVNFTGLIAIVDPTASWSAKWQHALSSSEAFAACVLQHHWLLDAMHWTSKVTYPSMWKILFAIDGDAIDDSSVLVTARMAVNESATWNELKHQLGRWFMHSDLASLTL
ncbi:TPA: hypothetical protein ACH3X2_000597 [Trebouxia sp. C0005]